MNYKKQNNLKNRIIITFLGNTTYGNSKYKFPDGQEFADSSYFGTSVIEEMSSINETPSHHFICGTKNSSWYQFFKNNLFKVLKKCYQVTFNKEQMEELDSYLKLFSINFDEAVLQKSVALVNQVCQNRFCLQVFIHSFDFSKIDNQTVLFEKMLPRIPNNSDIYLDITNGPRPMPLISFLTVKMLKHLVPSVTIKKIYYAKMDSIDINKRRDKKINQIFSRLKTIANSESLEKQQEIADKISILTRDLKQSTAQENGQVIEISEIENYFELAEGLASYNATGDSSFLSDLLIRQYKVRNDEQDRVLANLHNCLNDISFLEQTGKINSSSVSLYRDFNNHYSSFLSEPSQDSVSSFLKKSIEKKIKSDLKEFNSKSSVNFLKKLAGEYYGRGDYVRTIIFLASALECQFGSNSGSRNIKENKSLLHNQIRRYSKESEKLYKSFIEIYRAQFIHMKDKSDSMDINNSQLFKLLNSGEYLPYLESILTSFKCPISVKNSHKKHNDEILVTFLGSGGYTDTVYSAGAIELPKCNFTLFPLLKLNENIRKVIVIGTSTSSWDEFFTNLKQVYNTPEIQELSSSIIAQFQVTSTLSGSILEQVNKGLSSLRGETGILFKLFTVDEESPSSKTFPELFDCLYSHIHEYDIVDVDITHCFRQFPVVMYTALLVLQFMRTSAIRHVYYGNITPHSIRRCEGLSKINDLMKLLRGCQVDINDSIFNKCADSILDLLKEYSEVPITGEIVDFDGLNQLTNYAFNIDRFSVTGNIRDIIPLFDNFPEIKNRIEKNAVFEESCMYKYCRNEISKIAEFIKTSQDPFILKLRRSILDKLSWINNISTSKLANKKLNKAELDEVSNILICLNRAEFYNSLFHLDLLKAMLNLYQVADFFTDIKSNFLINIRKKLFDVKQEDEQFFKCIKKLRNSFLHSNSSYQDKTFNKNYLRSRIKNGISIAYKYFN